MSIPARLTFVTVGARHLPTLRAFYDRLGWPTKFTSDDFASYRVGGVILGL